MLAVGTQVSVAPGARAAEGPAREPVVIVLSWDGVRHDYLDRGSLPGLTRIARDGVRAAGMVPVYPSSTFPNHVSMATGTYPDVHGIVENVFVDRERGLFRYANDASWIQAEPLWAAAERQGVPAGVYFWVGSETEWEGWGARYRVTPFDDGVGEAEKLERLFGWLEGRDASGTQGAPARLVMSWWHGADRPGHLKGPEHPSVLEALQEQDAHLQRLLAELDRTGAWETTTLLVVSDHGMAEIREEVPVQSALDAAGSAAKVVEGTAVSHVFFGEEDPVLREAATRQLAALPGVRILGRAELERRRLLHPTRNGDLVLATDPPRTLRSGGLARAALDTVSGVLGWKRGGHGFPPEHPEMRGIFLAMGRGVPRGGRLPAVRAIDVAPTVAALLGIEAPRHAEGRAIALEPAATPEGDAR